MDVLILDPVRQVVDPRPVAGLVCACRWMAARRVRKGRRRKGCPSAIGTFIEWNTGQAVGPVVDRIAAFSGEIPEVRGRTNIPPRAECFLKNSTFWWTYVVVLPSVKVADLPKLRTTLIISDTNDRVCWADEGGTMVRIPPYNQDVISFVQSLLKKGYHPTLLSRMR